MNALTRAFVVVAALLAVTLVALVIPFVARVDDYAQQYKDMKLAFDTQVQEASQAAQKAATEMADAGTALTSKQEENEELKSQIETLSSDKKALQAQLAQAETTMARLSAASEVSTRVNETKDAQIAESANLIQKQIASLGELQSQIADLTQTIITVRSENRRLSDNYLRIQEENKSLVTQLSEAQAKYDAVYKDLLALGGNKDEIGSKPINPAQAIKGSVTKIDQVTEGLTFVQVNVGTRDQVEEGMEFTVFRGDKFVGKIQIASVDTAESVGRLTLGGGVQAGDAVRTGGR